MPGWMYSNLREIPLLAPSSTFATATGHSGVGQIGLHVDLRQGFSHGLQWTPAAVDAECDGSIFVSHKPLD
ncbi:hypothetical protein D3C77_240550 [compost metagenome]